MINEEKAVNNQQKEVNNSVNNMVNNLTQNNLVFNIRILYISSFVKTKTLREKF